MEALAIKKKTKNTTGGRDFLPRLGEGRYYALSAQRENITTTAPSIRVDVYRADISGKPEIMRTFLGSAAKPQGACELSEYVNPDGSCAVRLVTRDMVLVEGMQDADARRGGC